jgi:hypothetical protein
MAGTYYKYANRDAESQVNWADVGSGVSKMFEDEASTRIQKRKQIDDATREAQNLISTAPKGDFDLANQWVSDYANKAQEQLLMAQRLLKSGQMKPQDYTAMRQNVEDGTNQLFDVMVEMQETYGKHMERYQNGEAEEFERWQMEQIEGLGNLKSTSSYIDGSTGLVSIGKQVFNEEKGVYELDKSENSFATISQLRDRVGGFYDKFDLDGVLNEKQEALGEVSEAVAEVAKVGGGLNQVIETMDKKEGNYSLKDEQVVRDYKEFENGMVEAILSNENHMRSILASDVAESPLGIEYTFTYDENEWNESKNEDGQTNLIFIDRSGSAPRPVFTSEQKEAADNYIRTQFRSKIDQTKSIKTSTRPYAPADRSSNTRYDRQYKNELKSVENAASNIGKLYYGDQNEVSEALHFLRNMKGGENIAYIDREPDGVYIIYEDEDGNKTSEDFSSFYTSDGGLLTQEQFITQTINKITPSDNVNEVLEKGGFVSDREFNDASKGTSSTTRTKKSDITEAYTTALKAEAPDLSNTGDEDVLKSDLNGWISTVPGLDGYTFDTSGWGHNIVLKDANGQTIKTYEDTDEMSASERAKIIEDIVQMSNRKLDQEGKDGLLTKNQVGSKYRTEEKVTYRRSGAYRSKQKGAGEDESWQPGSVPK